LRNILPTTAKSVRQSGMRRKENGRWKINVETAGEMKEDDCHVLFSASGVLNAWTWPDIPGLHDYKGKLLHSADWIMTGIYHLNHRTD
jgi:cation diffusion facilitator CzcD-associated flavoprotein CzcO